MGVEPYLVASSLEAVLAQRLVRVLCKQCKQADHSPDRPGVQGASRHSRQHHHLPLGRLPRMPQHRFLRPARHLRVDGQRQRNPAADSEEVPRATRSATPPGAPACGRWPTTAGGWCAMGITTVEEVLSVTTAKEVARTTTQPPEMGSPANQRSLTWWRAGPPIRRDSPIKVTLSSCPSFNTKRCRPTARWPKASSKPPAARKPFAQMAGLGLRPVSLERADAADAQSGFALSASLSSLSFLKKSQKIPARALENFTRLLSSLLAAGVPLSRALVILYKEASTPAAAAKWKEIHDSGRRRHVAGRCDGKVAGDFSARLYRDGAGGRDGRVPRPGAGADRRLSGAREGTALEGDDGDALSDHPAGARDRRADLPADVLHSAIPDHLHRLRRLAAPADADRSSAPAISCAPTACSSVPVSRYWPSCCGPGSRRKRAGGRGRA